MRLTVQQTADIMGADKQFIRVAMQQGLLPIGLALKQSSIYTYHIDSGKLAKYLELDESEMLKGLERREIC